MTKPTFTPSAGSSPASNNMSLLSISSQVVSAGQRSPSGRNVQVEDTEARRQKLLSVLGTVLDILDDDEDLFNDDLSFDYPALPQQ
jgi:hypothetical protein